MLASITSSLPLLSLFAAFALSASAAPGGFSARMLHLALSLGLFGVFLVSIVDSSFVPLPIPRHH